MKKMLIFMLAILTTATLSIAQDNNWNNNEGWGGKRVKGEGAVVKETRDVKDFTGVSSGIGADIYLTQGSTFKVTIEGQKNILALLKTENKNGSLKINFEKGYSINYREPLKIYVEAPNFEFLSMSGSGNVKTENKLSGKKLNISISGSGDFDLSDLKYSTIDFGISGSGDVKISGAAETVKFQISGSGNIKANNLKAGKAYCQVSGSGDITCNVKDVLEAHVSGSGDIRYSGSPASVKTRVTGSGDIEAQ